MVFSAATRRAPSKRSPGGGDTFSSKRPRSCGGGTSSKGIVHWLGSRVVALGTNQVVVITSS